MTLELVREPVPLVAQNPLRRLRPPATARWSGFRPAVGAAEVVGVVLALELAVILRTAHLGAVGLNSDEAVYASQSGSLAGNPHFTTLFPVVRAHPLLLQVLMSPLYRTGLPDSAGRYVTAGFGVATVLLVHVLGRVLYSRWVGVAAALLLAVMPYHVTITRQILLDGPMTFFTTASLLCLAVAGRTGRHGWLVAAGACLGLAALSKETGVVLLGGAYAFVALVPRFRRPWRYPLLGVVLALGLTLTYPLVTALAGGGRSGNSYLVWQLTRAPNHSATFYLQAFGAMGALTAAVALLGLVLPLRHGWSRDWREVLLLCWAAAPVVFFELWPTKGFSYLTPVAPVLAVLAARALVPQALGPRPGRRAAASVVAVLMCLTSLAVPAARGVLHPPTSGLAAAGGLPGGREVGQWIAQSTPADARFMTIGPSMANLIQYYGGRVSDGLSVSPNPLHRNPSYRPIRNADAALRAGTYRYIVWDAYSGKRTSQFTARALELVARFHARPVHTVRGTFDGRSDQLLVVVYEVPT